MQNKYGKIYICPTPIGNLSDISFRLKNTLEKCDIVYSEDTRVTNNLLNHLDIKCKVLRLDQNTMQSNCSSVISNVKKGKIVAYCSDAGTPGISDPGLYLVREAYKANLDVEVLPGPCAAIVAYVASGARSPRFYFHGFFPRKTNAGIKLLQSLSNLDSALIFYESPNRLLKTLKTIDSVLPKRTISVCREMTKIHEDVFSGLPVDAYKYYENKSCIKGEIVIVIDTDNYGSGNDSIKYANLDLQKKDALPPNSLIKNLVDLGISTTDICNVLTKSYDIKKNTAYKLVIDAKMGQSVK